MEFLTTILISTWLAISGFFGITNIDNINVGTALRVLTIGQGGTGVATAPTADQILIGDGSGAYIVDDFSNYESGGGSNWTFDTNYDTSVLTASTTIPVWFKDAIYASSTLTISGNIVGYSALTVAGDLTGTTLYGDGSNITNVGAAAASALTINGKAAEAISKGQAVYISGATGQNVQFSLADNTIDAKTDCIGLSAETKTSGQSILIRIGGQLDNWNTSSWADGDHLYLSTAGSLANTKPTSGTVLHIADVEYSHASLGDIVMHLRRVRDKGAPADTNLFTRLGDDIGVNKISYKNYSNAEVAFIDSYGDALFRKASTTQQTISDKLWVGDDVYLVDDKYLYLDTNKTVSLKYNSATFQTDIAGDVNYGASSVYADTFYLDSNIDISSSGWIVFDDGGANEFVIDHRTDISAGVIGIGPWATEALLDTTNLTAERLFKFPDSAGTFAMASSTQMTISDKLWADLTGNADTCTTASAGDAAIDFFGAGVDAVTDATTCTNIEGTGLSITTSVLNWSASGIAGHDNFSDFVEAEHIDWTGDQGATNIHAGNYTDTNTTYLGGTNLTLVDTTFNVDDKFLKNDVNDTTAFGITMGSATTSDSMYIGGILNVTGVPTFPNDSITDAFIDWGNLTDLAAGGVLSGDCVDESHIADNGIDSEHYNDNSIDAAHIDTITCGRSMTWDATNDEVDADSELYTDTKCIWFEDPTADDDFKSIWTANGFAATITKIWCESDQTVNMDLQTDDGSPSDVNGADLVCDSTPAEDESMGGDATLADGNRLDLAITSVSGTPTWVSICWTYTKDD